MAFYFSPATQPITYWGQAGGQPYGQFGMSTPEAGAPTLPGMPATIGGGLPPSLTSPQANPVYQFAQGGAHIGGPMRAESRIAKNLSTAFQGNLAYANQALAAAFDPQNALFQQREQDLIEATRAGEAARGISMSPYGAAIESSAVGRFINDWQNEQIQRMASGVQSATQLQGVYEQAQAAAAGIYNNEIQALLSQYQIKGDLLAKAMDEILGGAKIQADVALGQYQALASASRGGGGGGAPAPTGGGLQMSFGGSSGGGAGQPFGGGSSSASAGAAGD